MRRRLLAIASAGGHWDQMMLLRASFAEFDVVYGSTRSGIAEAEGLDQAHCLPDCNRMQPLETAKCAGAVLRLIWKTRPHVVFSTGAAPGLLAILFGKMLGARTVWLDSIANTERLSISGQLAAHLADLHLTQWEHLSTPQGPHFMGGVI